MLNLLFGILNKITPVKCGNFVNYDQLITRYLELLPLVLIISLFHIASNLLILFRYDNDLLKLQNNQKTLLQIVGIFFAIIPVVTEEYIFRYLVFKFINYYLMPMNFIVMCLCSLMFSAIHIPNYLITRSMSATICQCFFVFFLSCVLCCTDDFDVTVALHYTYNVMGILVVLIACKIYFYLDKKTKKTQCLIPCYKSARFSAIKKSKSCNELKKYKNLMCGFVDVTTKNKDILKMYDTLNDKINKRNINLVKIL